MAFITEDQIENACVQVLRNELHYDEHLNLYKLHQQNEGAANAKFGRATTQEVVRLGQLRDSLRHLNPTAPETVLDDAVRLLTKPRPGNLFERNRAVTELLQKGDSFEHKNAQGVTVKTRVRYVDFENPANNHFAVVQQLTIKGKTTRRPDLLVFVNGLPLVFVELKNANEDTRQAYDKNLTDYKRDIGQLFDYNLVVVLSNGLVTKVGSHTADWEQFFNWEKESEDDPTVVAKGETDIERVMRTLFRKETLVDLLENFVLFYAHRAKIVAKNHQYLGVNQAVAALARRQELAGKLGVFWHTQGSGKSFSMAYLVQKARRVVRGGSTLKFVLVTDRDDLEDQLWKTFVRSGLLDEKQPARADSAKHLADLVSKGTPIIFTLIQKFKNPSGRGGGAFPELTARGEDYVVLVDEAHRSQYKDLGENLRRAFRGASYLAFTGTPLLDAVETTKEWFGGYVSQYNFQQSVLDGSTVPLFYHNRVPKMGLQNNELNEEFAEIMADENLSDEQQERLTRKYASMMTVLTDNDRLDAIARDVVRHFPARGYLGKAMMVSLDKPTAVRMYDRVQQHWKQAQKELQGRLNAAPAGSPERLELERQRKWMRETEMAVVVSEEGEEDQKFLKLGLDIRPHRALMNKTWGDDHKTIEDRFRDAPDRLRLVFVCAKWLTGFDAPTVSTLYLDKPLQNHTLMQTIARANRVAVALDAAGEVATDTTLYPIAKTNGLVLDYYGLMAGGRLEKALAKYAKVKSEGEEATGPGAPAEDFEVLLSYLDAAIAEAVKFLAAQGLSLDEVLASGATFDQLTQLEDMADTLSKTEDLKKEFGVYQTAVTSFYQACKPDILTEELLKGSGPYLGRYRRLKDALEYVRRIITRTKDNSGDFDGARSRADSLIDEAIVAHGDAGAGYHIAAQGQEINLSGLDLEKLQERFTARPHKNLAITDMVDFLTQKVQGLLGRNVGRVDLAAKLHDIIQNYNSSSSDVEAFFQDLKKYAEQLREEEKRAAAEGLSEEELELFDLLFVGELKPADKAKVKAAAQHLLAKLRTNETKREVLTPDWHKNYQLQMKVRDMIGGVLDTDLPEEGYPTPVFVEKRDAVYTHLLNQAMLGGRYWA